MQCFVYRDILLPSQIPPVQPGSQVHNTCRFDSEQFPFTQGIAMQPIKAEKRHPYYGV